MEDILDIPVFPNCDLETHCVQATLQMVLKWFFPERRYTLAELDIATSHEPDGLTWDYAVLLFLAEQGLDVLYIDPFDIRSFACDGAAYLRSIWDHDRYAFEDLNANLTLVQQQAGSVLEALNTITLVQSVASMHELEALHASGWLIMAQNNSYVLDGEEGFDGHYVLLTGFTHDEIIFNDCGNPPQKNRRVSRECFERSRDGMSGIIAVKIKQPV